MNSCIALSKARFSATFALAILFFQNGCHRLPTMQSDQKKYYAGAIFPSKNNKISHTFSVVNTTNKQFTIVGKRPSCTCTQANLDKTLLNPGERANLSMTVNSTTPYGLVKSYCILDIEDDDKSRSEIIYELSFTVYPKIRIEKEYIDFGNELPSPGRNNFVVTVNIFDPAGERASELLSLKEIPDYLEVERDQSPITTLVENSTVKITKINVNVRINWDKIKDYGYQTKSIQFLSSNDGSASLVVMHQTELPIVCKPKILHFKLNELINGKSHANISLISSSQKQFIIQKIEGGGIFKAEQTRESTQSQNEHYISFDFDASDLDKSKKYYSGIIKIFTDHPNQKEVNVSWSIFNIAIAD